MIEFKAILEYPASLETHHKTLCNQSEGNKCWGKCILQFGKYPLLQKNKNIQPSLDCSRYNVTKPKFRF